VLLREHPEGLTLIEIKSKLHDQWKSYNHLAPASSMRWGGLLATDPHIEKLGVVIERGFAAKGAYTLWGYKP
tara:strand:+ start:202 stop:417 length:216 start_codon:yes stop_codon:yes gene_type:complete